MYELDFPPRKADAHTSNMPGDRQNQMRLAAANKRISTLPVLLVSFLCAALMTLFPFGAAVSQSLEIPQDRFVEVNGIQLHYLDWGGDGPVMMLVPGLRQTAHWFDGIAPHFTDRYRVLGITRREHGASQKNTGQLSLDILVDDLSDFLRIFTSERAVMVGHSYAGIEIPHLANEHPDQVAAIILLDGVYDWPMWISGDVPAFPARWDFPDVFASFDAMDHWYRTTYAQVWIDVLTAGLRSQAYLAADGTVRWQFPFQSPKGSAFFALSEYWSEDAFAGIAVPILSIQADFGGFFEREFERQQVSDKDRQDALTWAKFDASVKRRGKQQLERAVPHAEHQMFADTHHWLFIQRPIEVLTEMDAFLRGD